MQMSQLCHIRFSNKRQDLKTFTAKLKAGNNAATVESLLRILCLEFDQSQLLEVGLLSL